MEEPRNLHKLSIVIPCYNEEEVISFTLDKILSLSKNWIEKGLCSQCEIICVNDGSKDETAKIIGDYTKKHDNVKLVSLSRNFGHQNALLAGYTIINADAVVSIDADLQDPPEVIERFLEQYRLGYEIVYGARNDRQTDSFFKRFTSQLFYKFMILMGVEVINDHADFRLVGKKALKAFLQFEETNLFIRATFPLVGFPSTVVFYKREERLLGHSKYPLKRMLGFACDGITSFSVLPLRLCSIFGVFFFLVSIGLIVWSIWVKFAGLALPGWTSTVAPLYLLGGIQLIFLGIVGEYMGKIYKEVKRRPKFIIQSVIGKNSSDHAENDN